MSLRLKMGGKVEKRGGEAFVLSSINNRDFVDEGWLSEWSKRELLSLNLKQLDCNFCGIT